MQAHKIPLFKHWVSEWLARSVIFAILMTCLFSFALYSSPVTVMGYYGVAPTDVQYAMVLIYGSTVTFLALDSRIVKYFTSRKYLLIGLATNGICTLICFHSKSWPLFLVCQFAQGITCALLSGIVLHLVFPRLHSTRARVIGYTILYAGIQISIPLYSIYCSMVLHYLDFNWLFYGANILLLLLTATVLITMDAQARLHKKIPLYQVDWIGYLFYTSFVLLLGYILIYGRQLGWFSSTVICQLVLAAVCILILFISREMRLKRPLINLRIFKAKNFVIGLLLLFVFYLFKGSTGLTYSHLETILKTDPLHTIPIWLAVISGTVLSMYVTARFILLGTHLIRMIIVGFIIMGLYYTYMLLFISVTGSTADFILPMFIYGIATGVLFVPIVTFTASAAPAKIAVNASMIGILARFIGFCSSMAINNELQLFTRATVQDQVRHAVNQINPQLPLALQQIEQTYQNAGNDGLKSEVAANAFFNTMLKEQILARASRDYYGLMLTGVVLVIIMLIFLPKMQQVVLRLTKFNVPY